MPITERTTYPIFELFTLDELHRRLQYAESYLLKVKMGSQKPSRRFIVTACGILNRPEEELFGPPEGE